MGFLLKYLFKYILSAPVVSRGLWDICWRCVGIRYHGHVVVIMQQQQNPTEVLVTRNLLSGLTVFSWPEISIICYKVTTGTGGEPSFFPSRGEVQGFCSANRSREVGWGGGESFRPTFDDDYGNKFLRNARGEDRRRRRDEGLITLASCSLPVCLLLCRALQRICTTCPISSPNFISPVLICARELR